MLRKADIYHGPYLDRAPDLIVLTIDERIHVDSLRLRGVAALEVHDHLDPENAYGYSGHHGVDGILAASGPGIRPGGRPGRVAGSSRWRRRSCACTGSRPRASTARRSRPSWPVPARPCRVAAQGPTASEEGVYSAEEEAGILERLRDLGYE